MTAPDGSNRKENRSAPELQPTTSDVNSASDQASANPAPMAIVLAAGKGTRMKSDLPKVLVPANGRPLITYVLDSLRAAGIGRITVVVGYKGELVKEALAQYADLDFVIQERQLGTGHAVMCCRHTLQNQQGPVVIVTGDSPMLQVDSVTQLLSKLKSDDLACLLGTLNSPDPTGLGRIVRDADGNFTAIVEEKDASESQKKISEVNMSTYVFQGPRLYAILDRITNQNQQSEYYVTDYPSVLLADGLSVDALPVLKDVEALSVNTVEHLAAVEDALNQLDSKK